MKVAGIVCEYNPFHNGHLYHIEKTREQTGADVIVGVISTHFVQRGENACLDVYSRGKMALLNGVDLVIALPTLFSLSSAERFAYGAVSILDSLHMVDYISFGSEEENLDLLKEVAHFISSDAFLLKLKEELKLGHSYAKALTEAVPDAYRNILNKPNNILAISYIGVLNKLNSKIEPIQVLRHKVSHDDRLVNENFASASLIREMLKENADVSKFMPPSCCEILNGEINQNKGPIFKEKFADLILYKLRSMDMASIKNIYNMSEGLEHKFKKAALKSTDFDELIFNIKSKRYPYTRISRMLFSALLDITKEYENLNPSYIRVIGANEKGRALLKRAKKKATLPMITKIGQKDLDDKLLALDLRASDIYALCIDNKEHKKAAKDFLISPLMV